MALEIISVRTVKSREINPSWKQGGIQIIETNHGTLYDNAVGSEYSFRGCTVGYNWSSLIGTKFTGQYRITQDSGLTWLKYGLR